MLSAFAGKLHRVPTQSLVQLLGKPGVSDREWSINTDWGNTFILWKENINWFLKLYKDIYLPPSLLLYSSPRSCSVPNGPVAEIATSFHSKIIMECQARELKSSRECKKEMLQNKLLQHPRGENVDITSLLWREDKAVPVRGASPGTFIQPEWWAHCCARGVPFQVCCTHPNTCGWKGLWVNLNSTCKAKRVSLDQPPQPIS